MTDLAEEAAKVMKTHGIGEATSPVPAQAEIWEEFKGRTETTEITLTIENRFYSGYEHGTASQIDWGKPVHAVFLDFKGDGMQLGMLLERLNECGEQYVFIGNPLPFNGGWHFTAVNDFEHPVEQKKLNPEWKNKRIWHRVNYIAKENGDGSVAIQPRGVEGCDVTITETCKFTSIFLIGGLMPHTLNATMSPAACALLRKHLELGTKFATIGHGLDVLIALGSPESSSISGFVAASFPNQEHLLKINGVQEAPSQARVWQHTPSEGPFQGSTLISASYWGQETAEPFFTMLGLKSGGPKHEPFRIDSPEIVRVLDFSKCPGISGASFVGDPKLPSVAVFVDNVADPIEAYNIISHLMTVKMSFTMISHSGNDDTGDTNIRIVSSETVFGNAMYGLKDSCCLIPTCPASSVPSDIVFNGFFVAGGQCPYFMMKDAAITSIIDRAEFAAAVCHGPELLIGSKWLHSVGGPKGPFISYYGCWMSFRDVLASYEKKKPGEVCEDSTGRLFTGNAPNSTKEMVRRACTAMTAACL